MLQPQIWYDLLFIEKTNMHQSEQESYQDEKTEQKHQKGNEGSIKRCY